nr:hypothetical protein [Tanacetum cinerariifolium]
MLTGSIHNNIMLSNKEIRLQSKLKQLLTMFQMLCLMQILSTIKPKNVKEAMTDPVWIELMQEELLQFKRLDSLQNVDDGGNDIFLGLQVNQSPCGIFINQSNYVLEILKKYGMESCDPVGTPMEIKDKLDLDQNGTPVDATKYDSMIGALMYLTSSQLDIVHANCLCARYQAKPTKKYLKEVKRFFLYLWGAVNTGLWNTKDYGFELTAFLDADYAGCKDTFKKAEYVSLSACCAQVLWIRRQLTDYGFHFNKIPIYYDSKTAIAISCNPDQSISRRNQMCWHTNRDDTMFTSMRCISRHEKTQVYGAILLKELTNQAMLESEAYKTYYGFASGEKTPKPKIKIKAKVAKSDKKKQPAKNPKAKGLVVLSKVALTEAGYQKKQERLSHITSKWLRGPDVRIYDSKSDKESWGDSDKEDDDDNDFEEEADINDDDSDDNDESDDEKIESNSDEQEHLLAKVTGT